MRSDTPLLFYGGLFWVEVLPLSRLDGGSSASYAYYSLNLHFQWDVACLHLSGGQVDAGISESD